MRRLILSTLVVTVAMAIPSSAWSLDATVGAYRRISGVFVAAEYTVSFSGYAGDGVALAGAPPTTAPGAPAGFAFVRVTRRSDGATHTVRGSGLTINVDPTLASASLSGTVTDASGSITIYATLAASGPNLFPQNYQYAQVPVPSPTGPADTYVDSSTWLGRSADARGGFSSSALGGVLDAAGYGYMDRGVWTRLAS